MKAFLIFSFYLLPYYLGIFDVNYVICRKFVNSEILFFKEQNCVKKNAIFWKIQEYFILDMKISKSINYCKNLRGSAFAVHKSKVLKQF
jgi:hypothetical protein